MSPLLSSIAAGTGLDTRAAPPRQIKCELATCAATSNVTPPHQLRTDTRPGMICLSEDNGTGHRERQPATGRPAPPAGNRACGTLNATDNSKKGGGEADRVKMVDSSGPYGVPNYPLSLVELPDAGITARRTELIPASTRMVDIYAHHDVTKCPPCCPRTAPAPATADNSKKGGGWVARPEWHGRVAWPGWRGRVCAEGWRRWAARESGDRQVRG